MNKQQKTYVLLTLVIAIWGLIGYNLYKKFYPTDTETKLPVTNSTVILHHNQPKDSITISNYRDPFLGKIITTKKTKVTKTKKVVNFPMITYNGSIKGSKKTSYIISVQNQQEVVKIGQTFKNVTLISANTKKIVVEYQKERKTIQLTQ